MAFVLREGFAVGGSNLRAARGAPAAAAFEVFVDAVLLQQPVPLAGVAGEHLQLEIERARNVENVVGLLRAAEPIGSFDGVHEIQVWDVVDWRGRLPLLSFVVWHAGVEERVADESRGDFVVGHVIDRRRGQHDVGPSAADDFGDSAASVVVVRDAQVAEFEAEVVGPQQIGSGLGFGAAYGGDFLGAEFRRAAVARRHRGGGDVTAALLEQRQRAGTLELDVIGMGVNREDSRSGDAAVHCNLAFRRFSSAY